MKNSMATLYKQKLEMFEKNGNFMPNQLKNKVFSSERLKREIIMNKCRNKSTDANEKKIIDENIENLLLISE